MSKHFTNPKWLKRNPDADRLEDAIEDEADRIVFLCTGATIVGSVALIIFGVIFRG